MPGAVHVRNDFSPSELRDLAETLDDKLQARRVRAIAAVLEGRSRTEAAKIGGMERQTLRDWVHRFNAEGPEGLKSHRSPGRPPKLNTAQRNELAALIARGPDAASGVCSWRLSDLVRVIREKFGVDHDEVSAGRIMKRLGYVYSGLTWQPGPLATRGDAVGHHGSEVVDTTGHDAKSCEG